MTQFCLNPDPYSTALNSLLCVCQIPVRDEHRRAGVPAQGRVQPGGGPPGGHEGHHRPRGCEYIQYCTVQPGGGPPGGMRMGV